MNLGTIWSKKKSYNRPILENKSVNKKKFAPKIKIVQSRNVNQSTKSYWGSAVWLFFHTISVRINNNYYNNNYQYIWNFIKKICSTLPCPFCQAHANAYVNKIASNQINTKEKLKLVLFNFHNSVNIRIGKKAEDISILEKYKKANIINILNLFEERFFHSYIGTRTFSDWIKNAVKKEYYEFVNIVRTKFN